LKTRIVSLLLLFSFLLTEFIYLGYNGRFLPDSLSETMRFVMVLLAIFGALTIVYLVISLFDEPDRRDNSGN
jgi:hypothetical protein